MGKYQLSLRADYHQFYLQDADASGYLGDSWTPEATESMVAIADGVIGVGTIRDQFVDVALEVLDTEPTEFLGDWDQVVDCSIDVPSGCIVIAGCTDYFPDAFRVAVESGHYRARIYFANLGYVESDKQSGSDYYRVVLWKGPAFVRRVLKDWKKPE